MIVNVAPPSSAGAHPQPALQAVAMLSLADAERLQGLPSGWTLADAPQLLARLIFNLTLA